MASCGPSNLNVLVDLDATASRASFSHQRIYPGGVEATLDAVLALQRFYRDPFERISLGMRRPVASRMRCPRRFHCRRMGRWWWYSRLDHSQRNFRRPMVGIVPCETGSHPDKMMLRQGQCLRVTIAQKRKQAERRCCKEQECQYDEKQDA